MMMIGLYACRLICRFDCQVDSVSYLLTRYAGCYDRRLRLHRIDFGHRTHSGLVEESGFKAAQNASGSISPSTTHSGTGSPVNDGRLSSTKEKGLDLSALESGRPRTNDRRRG